MEGGEHLYDLLEGFDTAVVGDRPLLDRLWMDAWKVWFPRGKADPAIALLRFDAERGEFWHDAGMRGVQYAFEAAKAYFAATSRASTAGNTDG